MSEEKPLHELTVEEYEEYAAKVREATNGIWVKGERVGEKREGEWLFVPDVERLSRLEKAVAYQGALLEKLRDSVDSVHQILPRPTEYGWKSQREYEEALSAMVGDG